MWIMHLISVKAQLHGREINTKHVYVNSPNCKFLEGYTFKSTYSTDIYDKQLWYQEAFLIPIWDDIPLEDKADSSFLRN